MAIYAELRSKFIDLMEQQQVRQAPIRINVRGLSPQEAIGTPQDQDYPLVKGREVLLDAQFSGCQGQAFTDTPGNFAGTLEEVANLELNDNRNRAVFIAALNALTRHAGMIETSVHCKDSSPPQCAVELAALVRSEFGSPRVAMVGFQPRMVQALSEICDLRVTDLDQANIGQTKFNVVIQGPAQTAQNLAWCDLALVTGSTVVNATLGSMLSAKPSIFFGISIAGPARLLGLRRFCPLSS